jgi:transposase
VASVTCRDGITGCGPVPQSATIPMDVERRAATAVIREIQEELALWKQRALAAEARVAELVRENEQLRAKVAALEDTVKELREELARLKRESKRSAGPFSKNKRKHPRKKPGRKKGQGRFSHLLEAPASPDTTHVNVPPPQTCSCGGSLEFLQYEEASTTDPPRDIRPHVTQFRVPVCRCRRCGATVRGKHPDVAPDQYGATAHRYGDRMMAVGHVLHYGMGIPQQKVPEIVEMFTGVRPTQSALSQDAMRRVEAELEVDYKVLRDSMKEQAVGHTDATGWRVDGNAAQMIVYATSDATVYDIREHYRNDEIREVFPGDYKGTLVGDGAKAFDANKLSDVKQQKCIFHGLKLIREAHEKQKGKAREFGETLKGLLQEGVALWHAYHDGKTKGYRAKVAELDARITNHLRERTLNDEDNQRLLRFFGEHHQRGNLTRFLHDPRVPPTNNLSEVELRYLIAARKVSQCSKNKRGAHARKVLASLLRTEKRTMEKERRQRKKKKPYADYRTSRAEERKGGAPKVDSSSRRRTGSSRSAVKQVEPPIPQNQTATPSHSVAWVDRIADLFQRARHRARTVKEAMAQVLGLPRSRSP